MTEFYYVVRSGEVLEMCELGWLLCLFWFRLLEGYGSTKPNNILMQKKNRRGFIAKAQLYQIHLY